MHPWSGSRRRLLVAGGVGLASAGLTGCLDGDDGEEPEEDEEGEEERPEGVSEEEFVSGPVPDEYLGALSLGGEERVTELSSKDSVDFVEYDDAEDADEWQPGRCCANCADFIPDKNSDGFGACAEVEGYVGGDDWCSVWEELPEPEVPEGMTEDELGTAEVPEDYRSATSMGDETRDPDDLTSRDDIVFMESVDALADGVSVAGQSCGNCADFIPDKNGDGWGACAEVEGYVAVEDWCSIWETLG